jgi:hypothetical protein
MTNSRVRHNGRFFVAFRETFDDLPGNPGNDDRMPPDIGQHPVFLHQPKTFVYIRDMHRCANLLSAAEAMHGVNRNFCLLRAASGAEFHDRG